MEVSDKSKIYSDPIGSAKKAIEMNSGIARMTRLYDSWTLPPLINTFHPSTFEQVEKIARSPYYTIHPKEKARELDGIMYRHGFKFVRGGTNRRYYSSFYNDNIGIKLATCDVGLKNNIDDMANQHILKPFCTKIFDVSRYNTGQYSGAMELIEGGIPIVTMEDFDPVAEGVFYILEYIIREKDIGMKDIGIRAFTQFCIRKDFGPIFCDFPSMAVIDRRRCKCNRIIDIGGIRRPCGGNVDYDYSFNHIRCEKCGQEYSLESIKMKEGSQFDFLLKAAGKQLKTKEFITTMEIVMVGSEYLSEKYGKCSKTHFVDTNNTKTVSKDIMIDIVETGRKEAETVKEEVVTAEEPVKEPYVEAEMTIESEEVKKEKMISNSSGPSESEGEVDIDEFVENVYVLDKNYDFLFNLRIGDASVTNLFTFMTDKLDGIIEAIVSDSAYNNNTFISNYINRIDEIRRDVIYRNDVNCKSESDLIENIIDRLEELLTDDEDEDEEFDEAMMKEEDEKDDLNSGDSELTEVVKEMKKFDESLPIIAIDNIDKFLEENNTLNKESKSEAEEDEAEEESKNPTLQEYIESDIGSNIDNF